MIYCCIDYRLTDHPQQLYNPSRMSRQLSQSQQIFLQRLMAAHVLSDDEAKKIWAELSSQSDREGGRERNLNETLSAINKSLVPNFSLEIKSVSLDLLGNGERTLYHAVVNKDADATAKAAATPTFEKSPHDLAFVRLAFENLIEKFNQSAEDIANEEEEGGDNNNRKKKKRSSSSRQIFGCSSSLSRIELVNLRLELPEPHKSKLSIQQVEKLLIVLELEGWLAAATLQEEDEEEGGRQSGGNKRKSTSGSDKSNKAKNLQIGPRTYLELPDLLKDLGLDRNHIPQIILHA